MVALLSLSSRCLLVGLVTLPRGATGLSAVCNCGIFPDHTHLHRGSYMSAHVYCIY